jgi:hypothetical protein
MEILTQAGRNKHGQRLVRAKCACGNEGTYLFNNIKRGRTKTCGHCGQPDRIAPTPTPAISNRTAPACAPTEPAPAPERGTPAWYQDQIAGKEAAALTLEKQANELEAEMKRVGITSWEPGTEPPDKLWNRATTTARKLRQEIARLKTEKDKAETGEKKDTRTQAEITRDKIAALRGQQR